MKYQNISRSARLHRLVISDSGLQLMWICSLCVGKVFTFERTAAQRIQKSFFLDYFKAQREIVEYFRACDSLDLS